jgi:hypothetical protein
MQATSKCLQLAFDTLDGCLEEFCHTSHLALLEGFPVPLESWLGLDGDEERQIGRRHIGT